MCLAEYMSNWIVNMTALHLRVGQTSKLEDVHRIFGQHRGANSPTRAKGRLSEVVVRKRLISTW